ncbi:MAG: NAD(P)-dependent oxidoreductase [Verrucomicrobiota bacterium]
MTESSQEPSGFRPPLTSCELDERVASPSDSVVTALRDCPGDFSVLGANGKMGFHLCLMLKKALSQLGRDDRVRAVSRFSNLQARREFEAIGCEVVPTDLSDEQEVEGLPDSENIFFLAGVKFGTTSEPALLETTNVLMPKLITNRFRESSFVALSTGCVYSFVRPESGGSREDDEVEPPGAYARSCLGREQAFNAASLEHGTRSALVRLNYAMDLRYGVLVDLALKIVADEPIDLTMGYVNVIWQGDALRQIVQTLTYASNPPFMINVAGAEVLRVRDLALELGKRLGREVRFEGEEAQTALLSNSEKARKLFGEPEMGIQQMMDWVVDWIGRGGELLGKPTHFQTRDGNY